MSVRPSVCPSVRPSVCRQGFRKFLKKLLAHFISYLAFTLMGWVSWPLFIFVFLALFWPSGGQIFGRKWGFRNFLKETIGSIHFIPGIYPHGVSFLTPIHFRVPSLIFGLLVAKYLAENGVSGTFWKKKLLAQFSVFPKNSHLCSTRLQNRNLYWIFVDEVGSDQSGVYCPHLWAQLVENVVNHCWLCLCRLNTLTQCNPVTPFDMA